MERLIKAKEILGSCWRASCNSISRLGERMVGLPRGCLVGLQAISWSTASVLLISCTTIKKAGVTAIAAGERCDCGDCIEWGAAAPILGATTGAFVGDVATEVMMSDKSKGMNMDNCAPDNSGPCSVT